jgi:hypothetical protein
MKIIMPSGKIRKVSSVTPFCEEIRSFNGRQVIYKEEASEIRYARGILIHIAGGQDNIFELPQFYVGNLSNEKVREIQKQLAENGYFDFQTLEYQKIETFNDIDGRSELPYHDEKNPVLGFAPNYTAAYNITPLKSCQKDGYDENSSDWDNEEGDEYDEYDDYGDDE